MEAKNKHEVLWAPWRMEYILGEKENGCVFCTRIRQSHDRENLILTRGVYCFVIMNRFPYNNGHLMVVPLRHLGALPDLTREEAKEMMDWLQISIKALDRALQPDGYNVGINLGKVAGAGIDDHLHFHIVPRWDSDTNFMPVIGETKVVSEALMKTYDKLAHGFAAVASEMANTTGGFSEPA